MEIKMHDHNFRRMFFDILRDTNTAKYSMTKFAALVGLILLTATIIMSLIVMWKSQVIDHVLLVELIGFVLTLLGFKNNFGFKGNGQTIVTSGNIDTQSKMGDGQHDDGDKVCATVNPKANADFVDDSIKG